MAANRELSQLGDIITVDPNGHLGIGTTTPADNSWNDAAHGNKEVAIDGGTGYGVLHFRGEGSNGTQTRFSTGVGDGKYWMAYDDVGGEHRIVVDANNNGNVGIGTSSPINKLMVDGGTDYNFGLRSSSTRSGLVIYPPGSSTTPMASALVLASDNTYRLGTQSYYNLIMNQSGHVSMPNQPGWHGTHTNNYGSTYNGGSIHNMVSSVESYNIGNHFNYSTNRFTVPVTGTYLIYGWDICENGRESTGRAIGAYKNGTGSSNRICSVYHQYTREYSFSTTALLTENDWVSFGCTEGGGVAGLFYGSLSYSGYGIKLLS